MPIREEDLAQLTGEHRLPHNNRLVKDTTELLAAFEVEDAEALAGELDFHGYIVLSDELVDLVLGHEGTGLTYPFHVDELRELADELAVGDE